MWTPTVTAYDLTERQRLVVAAALRVDGNLTREMHNEFWADIPKAEIAQSSAWTGKVAPLLNAVWRYQREVWRSARLSIPARAAVWTNCFTEAKQNLSKAVANLVGSPSLRAQVESAMREADLLMTAVSSGKPFLSQRGPIEVTDNLVGTVLAGLVGSRARLNKLLNPVWAETSLQDAPEEKFESFADITCAIRDLDKDDRRAVIIMVRGYIKLNFKETLEKALRTPGRDREWALRTILFSNASMRNLCTAAEWAEMATYYENEVESLSAYLKREVTWERFMQRDKENQSTLAVAISSYQNPSFQNRMIRHRLTADGIGSYVVGTSKLAGHKKMDSVK
jgi:hypothetical protein